MVQKIIYVSLLTVLFASVLIQFSGKSGTQSSRSDLSVQQLVGKYGYPAEVHNVTTRDGYVLTLHRIPHGKQNVSKPRTPILLIPGLLQSAWDFLQCGPDRSLPFLLTERGYDVWLGNVRGTAWSRSHEALNPDVDMAFWNFTIEDIAVNDLPTMIDYILHITKQDWLHYLGFSQGTTLFFMMGSERSDYLSKIKSSTAMGPAVLMKNPKSPIVKFIADTWHLGEVVFGFFNHHEFFGRSSVLIKYLKYICRDENSVLMDLCVLHFSAVFGKEQDELDKSMLSLATSNTPTGASLRQIVHMYQMIDSGNFCKYDEKNLDIYGQESPPHYNLSKVVVPVALWGCIILGMTL